MKASFSRFLALSLAGLILGGTMGSAFAWDNNQYDRHRFDRRHPRRAEVLGRDRHMSNELRNDRGRLGGNYSNLTAQDRSIRQQERTDAQQNGGYITRPEQRQLNQEERGVQQQINQDYQR